MSFLSWLFNSAALSHEHDWEVIARESEYSIQLRIDKLSSDGPPKPPDVRFREYKPDPCRKVCLSCGLCVDEIAAYEQKYAGVQEEILRRRAFAHRIWNDTPESHRIVPDDEAFRETDV